jgi:hypothetical protein
VLTLALLPVVAALVGGVPGTRQVVWQFAAWELHAIMQLVTVDVCAMRMRVPASAVELQIAAANPADKIRPAITPGRMMPSFAEGHHNAPPQRGECALRQEKFAEQNSAGALRSLWSRYAVRI